MRVFFALGSRSSSALEHRVESMEEGWGGGLLSWTKSAQHSVWEVRGGRWKCSSGRSARVISIRRNVRDTWDLHSAKLLGSSDPPKGRLRASRLAAWERSTRHSANPVRSSETPPYTSPHNNLHRFFVGTTQELPTSQITLWISKINDTFTL